MLSVLADACLHGLCWDMMILARQSDLLLTMSNSNRYEPHLNPSVLLRCDKLHAHVVSRYLGMLASEGSRVLEGGSELMETTSTSNGCEPLQTRHSCHLRRLHVVWSHVSMLSVLADACLHGLCWDMMILARQSDLLLTMSNSNRYEPHLNPGVLLCRDRLHAHATSCMRMLSAVTSACLPQTGLVFWKVGLSSC